MIKGKISHMSCRQKSENKGKPKKSKREREVKTDEKNISEINVKAIKQPFSWESRKGEM